MGDRIGQACLALFMKDGYHDDRLPWFDGQEIEPYHLSRYGSSQAKLGPRARGGSIPRPSWAANGYGRLPLSDGAIRANLERVVEFVPHLRERIAQVAGTLSFHVTSVVET